MKFQQILFFAFLYSGGVNLFAQTELTGSVVDKYGTPISGARVSIKNTSASTETNFDGSFSMSTLQRVDKISISAPGRATRVKKYKPGKKYVLRNSSFWYQPNDGWRPFAMLEFAVPAIKPMDCAPFGLMVGTFIKKFGFYGRAILSKKVKTEGYPVSLAEVKGGTGTKYEYNYQTGTYYKYKTFDPMERTGKVKGSYQQFGAGFIYSPSSPFAFYAGVSYATRTKAFEGADGKWYEYDNYYYASIDGYSWFNYDIEDEGDWDDGSLTCDLGLIFQYKHVIANIGTSIKCMGDGKKLIGSFGVGYIF